MNFIKKIQSLSGIQNPDGQFGEESLQELKYVLSALRNTDVQSLSPEEDLLPMENNTFSSKREISKRIKEDIKVLLPSIDQEMLKRSIQWSDIVDLNGSTDWKELNIIVANLLLQDPDINNLSGSDESIKGLIKRIQEILEVENPDGFLGRNSLQALKKMVSDETVDFDNYSGSERFFVDKLLETIRKIEAANNYSAVFDPSARRQNINFEEYKISEIIEFQDQLIIDGVFSTALGGYQFLRRTVKSLINDGVISPGDTFDKETQDRMALALLKRNGLDIFLEIGDRNKFQENISKEWAAIPKDESNESSYSADGVNHARLDTRELGKLFDIVDS